MFAQLITSLKSFFRQPKVRKRLLLALAILFVLQLYFVRELIAAELLFGLFFAVILAVVGIVYLLGAVGEWSISAGEVGARVIAHSARRGYATLEEISKKSFHRPHSESAR